MKNFTITKNKFKKEGSSMPDYRMSAKIGEEFVEIGGCWLKEDKNKQKFFSCKLSDIYVDHTKGTARKGFILVDETEFKNLSGGVKEEVKVAEEISTGEIPF